MKFRCFVSRGHTKSMKVSPRLSIGALKIVSKLKVDMASPRAKTASHKKMPSAVLKGMQEFMQHSTMSLMNCRETIMMLTIMSQLNSISSMPM